MSRPNILVFLSDDHGQWASRPYGNRELVTPTLDHLARSGARMGNAFTSVPGVLAGSRVVPYRQDPDEEHNRHVDPACAATVADLAARLDEHFARHEDSARSGLRVADLPIHNPHEPWRVNPADG